MRFSSLLLFAFALWPGMVNAQNHVLKLATLAPEGSNWTKALRAIDADVRQRTDGAVSFKLYTGGVQGDEKTMLRKIRIGQLHAGAFGGQGACEIVSDLLALEVPFLFEDYDEIDYVLEKTYSYYDSAFADRGYVFLGWADIGFVHILSKRPVRGIDDIKGVKVWRLEGEPITDVLFRKAKVSSVPLIIPDVLLGLQTNLVEVVYAPPAAAIVLQWFTRVSYVTELPINYSLGALLVAQKPFSRLSDQDQKTVRQVSVKHMREQIRQSRSDNEEAFQVLKDQGLELVAPDAEQLRLFRDLVDESISELVGDALSTTAYQMVLDHLAEYRSARTSGDAP